MKNLPQSTEFWLPMHLAIAFTICVFAGNLISKQVQENRISKVIVWPAPVSQSVE